MKYKESTGLLVYVGLLLMIHGWKSGKFEVTFIRAPQSIIEQEGAFYIKLECGVDHTGSINHKGQHNRDTPVKWFVNFESNPSVTQQIGYKYYAQQGIITSTPRFSRFSWIAYDYWHYWDTTIYWLCIRDVIIDDTGKYTCAYGNNNRSAHVVIFPKNFGISFIREPEYQDVKAGDDVRMSCSVVGSNNVSWEIWKSKDVVFELTSKPHSEKGKPFKYSPRVTWDWESTDDLNYDILISKVAKSDRGTYRCCVVHNGITVKSKEAKLDLKTDYDPVFVTTPDETKITFETNDVILKCSVRVRKSGIILVRWVKSKSPDKINPLSFGWSDGNQNNSDLYLFNVTPADSGFYFCEGIRQHPEIYDYPISAQSQLIVLKNIWKDPPKSIKLSLYTYIGKSKVLPCKISSTVKPDLMWADEYLNVLTHGDKILPQDTKETGAVTLDDSQKTSLKINPVQIYHGKSYFCFLANTSPVQWQEVQLQVIGCPPASLGFGVWEHKKEQLKCYGGMSQSKVSFGHAEWWCRQQGGHLAMPKNYDEVDEVAAVIAQTRGKQTDDEVWIGLDDFENEGVYKWADGRILTGNHLPWRTGEPDNKGNQDCVSFRPKMKKKDDDSCYYRYQFLCETPNTDWWKNKKIQTERCPPGWTNFDCGGLCYKKSTTKFARYSTTWDKAGLRKKRIIQIFNDVMKPETPAGAPAPPGYKRKQFVKDNLADHPWIHTDEHLTPGPKPLHDRTDYCWLHQGQTAMPNTARKHRAALLMQLQGVEARPKRADFEVWIGLRKKSYVDEYQWDDGNVASWIDWGVSAGDGKCLTLDYTGEINLRLCLDGKYVLCQKDQQVPSSLRLNSIGCGKAEAHVRTKRDVPSKDDQPNFRVDSAPHFLTTPSPENDNNTALKSPQMNIGYISHGQNVIIEDYPWMVKIFQGDVFRCGGILIGHRHVLTSAYCVQTTDSHKELQTSKVSVGLGSDDKYITSGRNEPVHMIKIHHGHITVKNSWTKCGGEICDHNIAIIELKRNLRIDCWNVRAACLIKRDDTDGTPYENLYTRCRIAGFGAGGGDTLKYCYIPPVDLYNTDSKFQLLREITETTCRISKDDGGSALACINEKESANPKWTVEGTYVGSGSVYDVYMKADKYTNWITSIIQDEKETFCPPGFSHHGSECYKLFKDSKVSITDASAICRKTLDSHGDKTMLAEPREKSKDDVIKQILRDEKVSRVWLGGTDRVLKGTWLWLKNTDRLDYTGWTPGHPLATDTWGECLTAALSGWLDISCTSKEYFICQGVAHSKMVDIPPEEKVYYETVCDRDYLDISCDYGRPPGVKIISAMYGRDSADICPIGRTFSGCSMKNYTDIFVSRCSRQEMNRCKIEVDNNKLTQGKIIPCQGTPMYLKLEYRCVYADHYEIARCKPKDQMDITCGKENGLVIEILASFVGAFDLSGFDEACPLLSQIQPAKKQTDVDCKSVFGNGLGMCNGRVRCKALFKKNPHRLWCPKNPEHWSVVYRCIPPDANTEIVCADGYNQKMSCEDHPGRIIEILRATHGRQSFVVCYTMGPNLGGDVKIGCYEDITKKIGDSCNGKKSCEVLLSKRVLGDPCPDVYPYFDITWRCKRAHFATIGNNTYIPAIHLKNTTETEEKVDHVKGSGQQQLQIPVISMIIAILVVFKHNN